MKPQTLVALHLTSALIAGDPSIIDDPERFEQAMEHALKRFTEAEDMAFNQLHDSFFE